MRSKKIWTLGTNASAMFDARAWSGLFHDAIGARLLKRLGCVRLQRLPRMADFAIWATTCEVACWPEGTFERAYWAHRCAAVESVIDADPVSVCVRELMADRLIWSGTATDLLRMMVDILGRTKPGESAARSDWPKNSRALAGRLRRAQPFLRVLGIEIKFSRDGRAGTRLIRIVASETGPPRRFCTVRYCSYQIAQTMLTVLSRKRPPVDASM